MHDRVDAFEQLRRKVADVAEKLRVEQRSGSSSAPVRLWPKKPLSKPIKLGVVERSAQKSRHDRPDIAHVAGDQDSHACRPFHSPDFPRRLAGLPEILEMSLIAQRIHRLPEAVMEIDAELAVRGEPFHRLAFPDGRIALDIVADLGRQHEEAAVDPAAVAERLFLEPGDPIALDI